MEHVVFFPAPDGTPAFRRLSNLDEALRFVEHLRNVENVGEASVHALTEVPLSFKAWYRVEAPQEGQQNPSEPTQAGPVPAPQEVQLPADPVTVGEGQPAVNAFAAQSTAVVRDEQSPAVVRDEQAAEPFGPAPAGAPTTIAEAIESYGQDPRDGSATGIVVPDQPLVNSEQFVMPPAPVGFAPSPQILPSADQQPAAEPELEHAARRERGIGFFAR